MSNATGKHTCYEPNYRPNRPLRADQTTFYPI